MKKIVFYKCNKCGNVVIKLVNSGAPVFCCGEPMTELSPLIHDGATEKHLPVVDINDNFVNIQVGSVLHPMTIEHYIQFVVLQTNQNVYIKNFEPNDKPICSFTLNKDEKIVDVYAYCNLHSLWKID